MKRRAISFITVLALCLSLCPVRAQAADDEAPVFSKIFTLKADTTSTVTYDVEKTVLFDARGYRYTISGQTAVSVKSTGSLYLTTGTIESQKGAGIEVLTGGFLCVDQAGMAVIGTTYGLDISSGATVRLSGGTFTGKTSAICAADGDYSALLASAADAYYAFFDGDGNPLLPQDVAGETTVVVKECTEHLFRYTANAGVPAHNGICEYCGATVEAVPCTFDFDGNGHAECEDCSHTLDIAIDPDSAVYDGTDKPVGDPVTVTLDGTKLTAGSDYTVGYTARADAGETIITVTGKTYNGTYQRIFSVTQAQPSIAWASNGPVEVDYDGSPVEKTDLPEVTIAAPNAEYLKESIVFSYRENNSNANFTPGLPTDAGIYEIIASLPEQTNYKAAASAPIILTIKKISPMIDVPTARDLVYNGAAQELVTPGKVWDGAAIQFAASENGPWSTDIPTGTDAGLYEVWYKVDETKNFNSITGTILPGVKIERKPITPVVELEYYTCVYSGGAKEPAVTVRDRDNYRNPLPSTEYKVEYKDNQNVGTAAVTVTDQLGGNYAVATVVVTFQITAADQDALTITNRPNAVVYGDVFTLETTGGSGSGAVTWEIIAVKDGSGRDAAPEDFAEIAVIDAGGQVTVKGVGTVTVRATKSGTDNGGDNHSAATAEWTFTAGKRPVTAAVTAEDKTYDGKAAATVHAEVAQQDLVSGDTITITVTGTFSDANAGTNKIVTVDTAGAVITGTNSENYIVTIPGTTTANIAKVVSRIVTPPAQNAFAYNGTEQTLVTEAIPNNKKNIQVEYALSENGPWSTNVPTGTDAGRYEVWYRVQESANYTGIPAAMVEVTIGPKSVTPSVTLDQDSYVYDGTEKKPAVTVKDGSDVISSDEYTVTYSNNVNAGTATVTVTDKAGGNYTIGEKSVQFTIAKGGSAVLTGTPRANSLTYNGQQQELVTVGAASGGHLEYSLGDESSYGPAIPKGTDAREYKVYYKVVGDSNHTDSASSYVFVTIQPKTVDSPVIELANRTFTYNGIAQTFSDGEITVKDGGVTIDRGEYTVSYSNNVNAGTATVHITDNNGGNYTVNGSAAFEIGKAAASFSTAPAARNLTYNGSAQALITAGVPEGGTAVYWLEGGVHSTAIPAGTDCSTYKVYYQVLGDSNHEDSTQASVDVTINKNTVTNPTVELSSSTFRYNGSEQKPTVTVKDDNGYVIAANEYTVTYGDANESTINVGTYTIKIASKADGNYSFEADRTITITKAEQTPLTITGKPGGAVCFGDTIQLGTTGGSGNGTVTWKIAVGTEYAEIGESTGKLTIKGVGSITVTATRTAANYEDATDTWTFDANPKPVDAVVTAANKVYDGNADAALSVTVPVDGITITVNSDVKGIFADKNVGANKTVTFAITSDKVTVNGSDAGNYEIIYPGAGTTTASITPAATSLDGVTVEAAANLTYQGIPQALVAVTGTVDGGSLAYSLDGVGYSLVIPTGKDAGPYTVYYKVLADSNHTDSEVKTVEVTIGKATPDIAANPIANPILSSQLLKDSELTGGKAMFAGVEVPGTFTWTRGDTKLGAGRHQEEVTFTPTDKSNYAAVTAEVEVTVIQDEDEPETPGDDNSGGNTSTGSGTPSAPNSPSTSAPSTPSTPGVTPSADPEKSEEPDASEPSVQTSVQDGAASTVVNAAAGDELVNEAVANQSENVVIKPEITGDVTKTEVSIPASAVSRLGSETDASLTVSTPVADVTIPNGALKALSGAGDAVSVVTERVENTVILALTADGEEIGSVPGGLTLIVPMEDAGPGTVAVLVYEDGTRETIRWSVAKDGAVRIPLDGSATVEIVDNSKEFEDVSEENWAADAVAFASAHELFNGTSEAAFSPELLMSRGMLATVLYNLEGQPDQELMEGFSDVGSDVWYAAGVSWAVANGVVSGYGDGQFGPDDNITREQLAVMLWRYMGSPAAGIQTLDFTDADQASGYAMEALCWAAANGILNGHDDGRLDPRGAATRAQAAQMLKNFIENA